LLQSFNGSGTRNTVIPNGELSPKFIMERNADAHQPWATLKPNVTARTRIGTFVSEVMPSKQAEQTHLTARFKVVGVNKPLALGKALQPFNHSAGRNLVAIFSVHNGLYLCLMISNASFSLWA
jgi:hypothetical protein